MPDQSSTEAPVRRSWFRMLAFPFILFLLGGAAIAWLLTQTDAGRALVAPPSAQQLAASDTIEPAAVPQVTPAPVPLPAAPPIDMTTRIASLEARIAQLEARGSGGGSARTDAYFAVFSARRAIERGVALGAVETELNARFGTAHSRAVAAIANESRQPTSPALLTQQLRDLAPALSGGQSADWWEKLKSGFAEIIVVRDSREPSLDPKERIAQAEKLLATGQIEAAISQISALPQRAQAVNWMASARRHAEALNALEELEAASLAPSVAPVEPESPARVIIMPPAPESGPTL